MIDIHVHYGQFYNKYYAPEQVINNLLNIGVNQIGLMPTLTKQGDNIAESHKIFERIIVQYPNSIIPILWIHPSTKIVEIERMLIELPYKIIKIHGYFHDWHKHWLKFEEIVCLAKKNNLPIMLHTGGRKESYAFKYKNICVNNPQNIFILAHSRPVTGTINILASCKNVYCDIAFTPIKDIKLLLKNNLEDRILFGSDYPIISSFRPEIDENIWYKDTIQKFKNTMDKKTFKKITETNLLSLLKNKTK